MTDPRTALTALITEHSGLTGVRAGRLARRIVAEWLPVVRREVLAEAADHLDREGNTAGMLRDKGSACVYYPMAADELRQFAAVDGGEHD